MGSSYFKLLFAIYSFRCNLFCFDQIKVKLCQANLTSIYVQFYLIFFLFFSFQLSKLLCDLLFLLFYISTQQINFDLELDPVKLLGDVEVVRSLADKKKGPKFYVHAKRNPLEAEVNNYDIFQIIPLRHLPVIHAILALLCLFY